MDEHSTGGFELRIVAPSARPSPIRRPEDLHLERSENADLTINPRRVLYALICIVAALALASTAAGAMLYMFEWPEDSFGHEMVKLVWLDTEHNIPTLYQCAAMFAASALFAVIGERYRRARLAPLSAWYILAAAFTFLAWDEGAQIHEKVGFHFGTTFDGTWLFFYVPVATVLIGSLVPFLMRLPARTRSLLIASGALYVGGAAAFEIVGQLFAEESGRTNAIYAALATTEEVLEMLGVALLIFTLLQHLGSLTRSRGFSRSTA